MTSGLAVFRIFIALSISRVKRPLRKTPINDKKLCDWREVFLVKTSARNHYYGTVLSVRQGLVNDEIEILLDSSNTRITSVISSASRKSMGLETGKQVIAIIKEEWVILVSDSSGFRFAARNNFPGTVVSIKESGVTAEVNLRLLGGESLTATVTSDAVAELGIKAGDEMVALIKAPTVIVGVRE
jgi:molybdate transport system regulatory protein